VLDVDGAPARGAVVVGSAGGRAVTDGDGRYRLRVPVPPEATRLQVFALDARGEREASAVIPLPVSFDPTALSPLLLSSPACAARWIETFGFLPGAEDTVGNFEVFDDGSGPALYVAGAFAFAGGAGPNLVKWDGTVWSDVLDDPPHVEALTVFDDGGGPALHLAVSVPGLFEWRVLRLEGASLVPLGGSFTGGLTKIDALAVYDDGAGDRLYAAGVFTTVGGVTAQGIARWDGTAWSEPGGGIPGGVEDLAVFDDGTGPGLYAVGNFLTAGGSSIRGIARWDGTSWSAVGPPTSGQIHTVAVHDDGTGPALYVGGFFFSMGGLPANRVARWDGSAWSALGSGIDDGEVLALRSFAEAGGPALYAGGDFTQAGGLDTRRIARWDGASWSSVADGVNAGLSALALEVQTLAEYDAGDGPALYIGGAFSRGVGVVASNIVKWDGATGAALGDGLFDSVASLASFDDGSGRALFAAGEFTRAGSVPMRRIGKWDGDAWSALGAGIGGTLVGSPNVLAEYDDGTGNELYAGGFFTLAGGSPANFLAKWDGVAWSALGADELDGSVNSLCVFDDGTGPALFAGGEFSQPSLRVAKWDGSAWSPIPYNGFFRTEALAVFDDGSGPALYAGASSVKRWDGGSWTSIGDVSGSGVRTLLVFDDGHGPALYAGGRFTSIGGVIASNLARWDGTSWSEVAGGTDDWVYALAQHDAGGGARLCVAGDFTIAGGLAANRIASWNRTGWSALGGGLEGSVQTLLSLRGDDGPSLYAGGEFGSAPDTHSDSFLARWGCVPAEHVDAGTRTSEHP